MICLTILALPASAKECTEMEAYAALSVVGYLDSWKEVFKAFKEFGHCDGALIAEGFDDVISILWADQWKKIPEMIKYIDKDRDFRHFVFKRIGTETISYDRWEVIVSHAQKRCPVNAKEFCSAILKTK